MSEINQKVLLAGTDIKQYIEYHTKETHEDKVITTVSERIRSINCPQEGRCVKGILFKDSNTPQDSLCVNMRANLRQYKEITDNLKKYIIWPEIVAKLDETLKYNLEFHVFTKTKNLDQSKIYTIDSLQSYLDCIKDFGKFTLANVRVIKPSFESGSKDTNDRRTVKMDMYLDFFVSIDFDLFTREYFALYITSKDIIESISGDSTLMTSTIYAKPIILHSNRYNNEVNFSEDISDVIKETEWRFPLPEEFSIIENELKADFIRNMEIYDVESNLSDIEYNMNISLIFCDFVNLKEEYERLFPGMIDLQKQDFCVLFDDSIELDISSYVQTNLISSPY